MANSLREIDDNQDSQAKKDKNHVHDWQPAEWTNTYASNSNAIAGQRLSKVYCTKCLLIKELTPWT